MNKHLYCCQNAAQNFLDHIIPVPDDFNVDPKCLHGLDQSEFINGLKAFTEIIQAMYIDMIQNTETYGLPLVEDIQYEKYNPKAGASWYSAFRLVTTLHNMVQCGELTGEGIAVNKKIFAETNKKLKNYSVSNTPMILKKLCDYGFIIQGSETFTISHADGGYIIPALYGYMSNVRLYKYALFSLNYFLATPQDTWSDAWSMSMFAEYLAGEEREFYESFNRHLLTTDLVVGKSDDYSNISFRREYVMPKGKPILIRFHSDHGTLRIGLRLRHINSYSDYIETVPERVKQIFRRESNCRLCKEPCENLFTWTFEGITYAVCGYMYYFDIADYKPEDVAFYNQIILREVKAAGQKVKKT
ncbi:MAG: hypothetical protein FWC71_07180 [Defluviitaleaceae bacterium]|nr:hypothetical protein [Defluviitaleaceae bacterium]